MAGVVVYDVTARPGHTLSERVDDYRRSHRYLTESVLLLLYLHLARKTPSRLDPIHLTFSVLRALRSV